MIIFNFLPPQDTLQVEACGLRLCGGRWALLFLKLLLFDLAPSPPKKNHFIDATVNKWQNVIRTASMSAWCRQESEASLGERQPEEEEEKYADPASKSATAADVCGIVACLGPQRSCLAAAVQRARQLPLPIVFPLDWQIKKFHAHTFTGFLKSDGKRK